ncbi:MAG: ecotin family protein [Phycisphaerae bacterium]|nr:ecotin family protein [Phycisphaerae bacterium]
MGPIQRHLAITLLAALTSSASAADEHRYLKAFPAAGKGMTRHVILLPHKERGEEDDFRIELIVGKQMLTDGVNRVMLSGTIQAKPLKGWGFTYYEVGKFGPAASTLIGVPPGTPKVQKFVTIPSTTIRYNSRIPLVVYVPQGAEVRYRLWQAAKTTQVAPEG